MTISLESLGWNQMNPDEKLEFVQRLWDEIVASVPPGGLLSDAQREELRRRIADAEANPHDSVAWEDALEATLKRLSS